MLKFQLGKLKCKEYGARKANQMSTQMSEFNKGRNAVVEEITSGDIHDVAAAYRSFSNDRPDTEYQWGYFSALHDLTLYGEVADYDK